MTLTLQSKGYSKKRCEEKTESEYLFIMYTLKITYSSPYCWFSSEYHEFENRSDLKNYMSHLLECDKVKIKVLTIEQKD